MNSQLRNCILIALAFDASAAEVEAAHDFIDRCYANGASGIDPQYLVSAQVPAQQPAHHTPTAAAPGSVDSKGFPWDERIHSSNKKTNGDGTWVKRRNVPDNVRASVEAALLATMGASQPAAVTPTMTINNAGLVTGMVAPSPPGLPTGLPPIPGAAAINPAYTNLVKLIADNTNSTVNPAGRLTDDFVGQVLTHYGVADGSLQSLAHAPAETISIIDSYLCQQLGMV